MSFMHQYPMLPTGNRMVQTHLLLVGWRGACSLINGSSYTKLVSAWTFLCLHFFVLALANRKQITEGISLSLLARKRQCSFDHIAFIKKGVRERDRPFFNTSAHASSNHGKLSWMDLWPVPVHLIPLIIIILCNRLMAWARAINLTLLTLP